MQIEQGFKVDSPLKTVWAAFRQPEQLVSCLPGASIDGEPNGGVLPLVFKVKLGPIAANFKGVGDIQFDDEAHSGAFSGSAVDHRSNSRVKGLAQFELKPSSDNTTEVKVAVDFSISGPLAQFSRENLVRSLADQLTLQFASNLQWQLTQSTISADSITQSDVTQQHKPEPALRVSALLLGACRRWLQDVMRRIRGEQKK